VCGVCAPWCVCVCVKTALHSRSTLATYATHACSASALLLALSGHCKEVEAALRSSMVDPRAAQAASSSLQPGWPGREAPWQRRGESRRTRRVGISVLLDRRLSLKEG